MVGWDWETEASPPKLLYGLGRLRTGRRGFIDPAHGGEKETGGPPTHQYSRERFHTAKETPLRGQDQITVTCGGISNRTEIDGRGQVWHGVAPGIT